MNIGKKIKAIRKEKKLTQKELGNLINKSEISIRKYEANGNVPLDVIIDIAKALNVDAAGLIPKIDTDNKSENSVNSLKVYLEAKNYFIDDVDLLEDIEEHILEYIKFKIYEKNKNQKYD